MRVHVYDNEHHVLHEHNGHGGVALVSAVLEPEGVLTRLRAFNERGGEHSLETCESCARRKELRDWWDKSHDDMQALKAAGYEVRDMLSEQKVTRDTEKRIRADYLHCDPNEVNEAIQTKYRSVLVRLQQTVRACHPSKLHRLAVSLDKERERWQKLRDDESQHSAIRSQGKAYALAYGLAVDMCTERKLNVLQGVDDYKPTRVRSTPSRLTDASELAAPLAEMRGDKRLLGNDEHWQPKPVTVKVQPQQSAMRIEWHTT